MKKVKKIIQSKSKLMPIKKKLVKIQSVPLSSIENSKKHWAFKILARSRTAQRVHGIRKKMGMAKSRQAKEAVPSAKSK